MAVADRVAASRIAAWPSMAAAPPCRFACAARFGIFACAARVGIAAVAGRAVLRGWVWVTAVVLIRLWVTGAFRNGRVHKPAVSAGARTAAICRRLGVTAIAGRLGGAGVAWRLGVAAIAGGRTVGAAIATRVGTVAGEVGVAAVGGEVGVAAVGGAAAIARGLGVAAVGGAAAIAGGLGVASVDRWFGLRVPGRIATPRVRVSARRGIRMSARRGIGGVRDCRRERIIRNPGCLVMALNRARPSAWKLTAATGGTLRTALQRVHQPRKIRDRNAERAGAGAALPNAEYRDPGVGVPTQPHRAGVASDVEENLAEAGQRRYVRCRHAAHSGAETRGLSRKDRSMCAQSHRLVRNATSGMRS